MLADHLGSGDYTITRAVFVVVLLVGLGVATTSIARGHSTARAIGLAVAAILLFAAVQMHFHWEAITDAADRMTGPAGGELRFSELDDFARRVFGGGAVIIALWVLVVMWLTAIVQQRRHPTV